MGKHPHLGKLWDSYFSQVTETGTTNTSNGQIEKPLTLEMRKHDGLYLLKITQMSGNIKVILLRKLYFMLFGKYHPISPTPITASAVQLKIRINVSIPRNGVFSSVTVESMNINVIPL